MPDINGIELCKTIKEKFDDIYFILLTAKISLDDKIEGFEAGADDYLTKPYKFKELLLRIKVGYKLITSIKNNNLLVEKLNTKNIDLKNKISELKISNDKIINYEKLSAIGKMASVFSHELKNPLFTIKTFLNSLDKSKIKNLDRILEKIDFSFEVIENINKFYKSKELELEKIDLKKLIFNVILSLKNKNNIEIKYEIPKNIFINVDRFQFKIVLMNILKNAIEKFEEEEQGKIFIKVIKKKVGIKITIFDNGKPIEELNGIFELFKTTKSKGTGLGLSFSKMIIEKHNGELLVENKKNGVEFTIII